MSGQRAGGVGGRRTTGATGLAKRWTWAAFAVAIAAAGCGRGRAAPAALQPLPEMARLYYDNGGGIQDSVRQAVRDAATFSALWQRATSGQTTPPALPTVDFRREMVLVAGAGRMTPDDQIHVDSVGVRKLANATGKLQDVLTAWVTVTEGCRRFRSDAYPVEIVRVSRYEGPVRFVDRRVQATGCR